MSVRLAFSVATQVDADVLLVDEVLAVGDAAFQQKCFDEFHRLKRAGKTIILVTHDMSAVERFCDRALLMERGRIVSMGEPRMIARAYNELNFGAIPGQAPAAAEQLTEGPAQIRDCWFEDPHGARITSSSQDVPLTLCFEVAFSAPIDQARFALHLRNEVRHTIFATSSDLLELPPGGYAAGDAVVVRARVENWLAPGRYDLTPTVARWGTGADVLDIREDLATIVIHGNRHSGGTVEIPHTLEIHPA
jgi:hypothetical protein